MSHGALDPDTVHRHSGRHRPEVEASRGCGCFYCRRVFAVSAIREWLDEPGGGQTAFCPLCGIDAVLGDASGLPVTDVDFLAAMHRRWF